MADQKASGCLGWVILGVLVIAALSQCGKEDAATPSPSALLTTPSTSVPAHWRYVQPDTLRCRAGPTAESLSLRSLSRGQSVGVLRTEAGWSQIKGDVLCWAKSSYLDETPPAPKAAMSAREDPPRERRSVRAVLSAAAIRRQIIQASIDNYPGNCPCPYNTARNGSRCGGRSAYNRGGGYAPLCYAGDVSAADVAAWREHR